MRVRYIVLLSCALQMAEIVFKDKARAPLGAKLMSLFPGLGYAAGERALGFDFLSSRNASRELTPSSVQFLLCSGYKVLQRVYKFGGQPFFNDYLTANHRGWFVRTFGERNGKSVMSATAGS